MLKSKMEFTPNDLHIDEFGRPHGVLLINKSTGPTSHDIVYRVRKILNTKAVGHAGALDPFASGLLIVLVGKATKLSNTYLNYDKGYLATVLFGVSTTTADPEGEINATLPNHEVTDLDSTLQRFIPGYEQTVPVFSSVKVNGQKLRELAHKSSEITYRKEGNERIAEFHIGDKVTEVRLPQHYCKFTVLAKQEFQQVGDEVISKYELKNPKEFDFEGKFTIAKINVRCTKGTYIRALAEDIGKAMQPEVPSMLAELERTAIGEYDLSQAITLEQLAETYGRK